MDLDVVGSSPITRPSLLSSLPHDLCCQSGTRVGYGDEATGGHQQEPLNWQLLRSLRPLHQPTGIPPAKLGEAQELPSEPKAQFVRLRIAGHRVGCILLRCLYHYLI